MFFYLLADINFVDYTMTLLAVIAGIKCTLYTIFLLQFYQTMFSIGINM